MTGDLCGVVLGGGLPLWAKYLQMFLQPTALNAEVGGCGNGRILGLNAEL